MKLIKSGDAVGSHRLGAVVGSNAKSGLLTGRQQEYFNLDIKISNRQVLGIQHSIYTSNSKITSKYS